MPSLYVFVVLTLAAAFTIIALVLAILAFVKAQNEAPDGPTGGTGDTGPASSATDFEVPAYTTDAFVLNINPATLTSEFIVFLGNPPLNAPVEVSLPLASTQSGKIYRLYNQNAIGGVNLSTQSLQDSIQPSGTAGIGFNPLPRGFVGYVISDGVSTWALNI